MLRARGILVRAYVRGGGAPGQLFSRRECPFLQHLRKRCTDIPRCRLSKTQGGFPVLAFKILNQLPSGVKRVDWKKYFTVLKSWLLTTICPWRSGLMLILGVLVGVPAILSCHPKSQIF